MNNYSVTVDELVEKTEISRTMVDIQQLIHTDVFNLFSVRFAKEHRPYVRANATETQTDWCKAVRDTYREEWDEAQRRIFEAIPERLHVTKMYRDMKDSANY